ncbi:MAG: glycosyltransferase [Clostridiales bacterium]|nr:glycosyltransferase [Clostridiales bacterium]
MNPLDAVVLIPSLHPDHLLVEYAEDLLSHGFKQILIVDDGSGDEFASLFEELNHHANCQVIGYPINQGKGHALKYGMRFILENYPDAAGIVTADSDGQHTADDVLKVAESLVIHPKGLIIGSRDFKTDNVPWTSLAGNRLTSFFFAILYGKWLPDTQTGLRGFSLDLIPLMLEVPGDRFEYEMNMLILASNRLVDFYTVKIQTIYIEENRRTHYRLFKDSALIYGQLFKNFFKYASSSGVATFIDILLFTILDKWVLPLTGLNPNIKILWGMSLSILIANTMARAISSAVNFKANKAFVFQVDKCKGAFPRYVILASLVLMVSTTLISVLNSLFTVDKTILKILVDTVLFFVNYRLQRSWVFAEKKTKRNELS